MSHKIYSLVYHEGIQKYLNERRHAFHTPGHKGHYITNGISGTILPSNLMALDISASYEREDLYNPLSFLKQSMENAREIYGTVSTHYLVNGSTGGNQAALISVLNPGDKILMPRNVHKLIYGALVATRAQPVYLPYGNNGNHHHPLLSGIDPKVVEAALVQDTDIKVVYLVNPTYTGACSDIKEIVKIAHNHKKIVVVDEAHGAHFMFHPNLPQSAISAGADIVVQSAHKTLNALSQTALLHVCSDRVDKSRVELSISMFQTTSPNTIFLLSIESAVVQMANEGYQMWGTTLEQAGYLREIIKSLGFRCYDKYELSPFHVSAVDETKLYIDISSSKLMGYEAKALLGKQRAVEAELADDRHILFFLTIGDTDEDINHLREALEYLASQKHGEELFYNTLVVPELASTPQMMPTEAFYAEQEDVGLSASIGRLCAEMITPYPPGIPILMPGELITAEIIDYIKYLMSFKATFAGSRHKDLSYLRVIR